MADPLRAQCPVCFHSILVRDGKFVAHASTEIRFPGQTAKACRGSDQPIPIRGDGDEVVR